MPPSDPWFVRHAHHLLDVFAELLAVITRSPWPFLAVMLAIIALIAVWKL